ncbi:MAG: metallophosphoesterase [Acidobacteria bacterium]|nr:metallophosphoesterase [Acidobacteriota bacterium]
MYKITGKMRMAAPLFAAIILLFAFSTICFAEGGGRYAEDPWAFGLMADTQWTNGAQDPEGANPNTVSAALAGAIQQELAGKGVKFVIQVGDLSDLAGDDAVYTRAEKAQELTDDGVGFFPLRGNHETYGYLFGYDPDHDMDLVAYRDAYPQVQGMGDTWGATNFSSPSAIMGDDLAILDGLSYAFDYDNATFVIVDVEQTEYHEVFPEPHPLYGDPYNYVFFTVYQVDFDVVGVTTVYDSAAVAVEVIDPYTIPAGTWFRIDSSGNPSTNMYAWDMENPDQTVGTDYYFPYDIFVTPKEPGWAADGSEFWPGAQQDWISARLDKDSRGTEHAFVLSHRGLMGTNHVDGFFGSNPGSKSSQQNPFYASLADNGVRYMLSGHDHLHNRALVDSPDGENQVQQIIHMAASTKFYGPASLNSFTGYYGPVKQRETEISQDLYNVGYYVYNIDGPRVTVDYYADSTGGFQDNEAYPHGEASVNGLLFLPPLDFVKQETYGYSTNGQQFQVAQGESYTGVKDSFGTTAAEILAGTNNSSTTDETPTVIDDNGTPEDSSDDTVLSTPRALTKVVNTGWVANPDPYTLKSDIFSLWGMSEIGAEDQTDTYVLSMSFDFRRMVHLGNGGIGIATCVDGEWVNAVDENFGGEKKFVVGKYKPQYGLGTYGVDPSTKTAWAVLNYNADFAVAMDIEQVPGKGKQVQQRTWNPGESKNGKK